MVGVVAGLAFWVLVGRLALVERSWFGLAWALAAGSAVILASISYLRNRVSIVASYLAIAVTFAWFGSLLDRKWLEKGPVNESNLLLAAALTVTSILYLTGYYKSRGRKVDPLSFWWWIGPRR